MRTLLALYGQTQFRRIASQTRLQLAPFSLPPRRGRMGAMEFILGIPIWLLFGILGAWIATTKGRSGCGWFLVCSVLGPIGLILAAVISKKG
jgi:hypothetical protein